MKLNSLWKTLNRDQRRAWNAWAKSNLVLLDDGSFRRVSGHKAMTMVLRNRTLAGDAINPTHVPDVTAWLDGALSTRDAGPWTENAGYVGFRADQDIAAGTKWFVWASAPVLLTDETPLDTVRFITVLNLGAMVTDDVVGSFGETYQSIQCDWHPPFNPDVNTQAWDPPRQTWFRLHHYFDGQLSPGRIMSGFIAQEL
jgi:hypothetical protein